MKIEKSLRSFEKELLFPQTYVLIINVPFLAESTPTLKAMGEKKNQT